MCLTLCRSGYVYSELRRSELRRSDNRRSEKTCGAFSNTQSIHYYCWKKVFRDNQLLTSDLDGDVIYVFVLLFGDEKKK